MTHDFGLHITQELGNRFGLPTASWPASAEQVTPFFTIVVNALGTDAATRWFEGARTAHHKVVTAEQNRTHNFGFPMYLDVATEAHKELGLPVLAAFEATKAAYEITRWGDDADVEVYFDCVLRACARSSSQTSSTSLAAATGR
ncbi:hypothetical protein ACGFX8_33970 [Streptomyces sp. NPDC048362]|uniref:hypothetical protein n=1 Tax=Streptomyces sp. NPDC048362 TaxID=3365539 RepID=UPI00371CC64C